MPGNPINQVSGEERRVELFGVPVDSVDMDSALSMIDAMIASGGSHKVLAVNPEKVMAAQADRSIADSLRSASLLIPDGIGVVLATRLLHGRPIRRVAGADLMPEICALAARRDYKVFLYGGRDEINKAAVAELQRRYPQLSVVGSQHGYLDDDQMPQLVQRINASGAQVLFLALGSPRQELWMEEHLPHLSVAVCQGVGGTFDVLAGAVKRAPMVFQRLHLEWFFRLLSDPRRIVRQTALPRFLWLVARTWLYQIFRRPAA